MPVQSATTLFCDNGTTVDTGTGIDVRFLSAANPAVANDTQTASFSHTNDNVERTFDPANAAVTNTNNAGTTLFRCGYGLRLSQDMTPTDDTNCDAFLPAQTLTVNVWSTATQTGGTYVTGTYGPTMRASLWRYNPATDAGILIAAGTSTTATWNVAATGGDLGTFKNSAISIVIPTGVRFAQGEVPLLQLGLNTGTVPNPTLGTGAFIHTLRVADPTNPTRVVLAESFASLCSMRATSAGIAQADARGALVKPVLATSNGVAAVSGVLGATKGMVGAAPGAATAQGVLAAVKGLRGESSGVSAADGRLAKVAGMTGTANVGQGGVQIVPRPFYIPLED